MVTFKICVQKQRKDGTWPVYIRVTHRGKVGYLKTDKVVWGQGLNEKTREVCDPFVVKELMNEVVRHLERLNRLDVSAWTLPQVMTFLRTGEEDLSFSEFARRYIREMIDRGQVRNARNYEFALNHLERYMGTTNVVFKALSTSEIERWMKSLSGTRRAKEMYPVCLRQVFKAALLEYNDYDRGLMRIKVNPWMRVRIPKAETPEKLAVAPEEVRAFFAAPLPESKMAAPLSEVGHDVAMMVMCLAGINTVDLYNLKKGNLRGSVLCYRRAKTTGARADGAYIEMRVPGILMPLLEKYATGDDDDFLLSFHKRFSSSDSFGSGVNAGIRQICRSLGMRKEDWYCVYTFRHTWGTVAQNDCGASIADVGFAMNHSQGHGVTRGYLKIDFTPAWELNEKVVDFIFFSTGKGRRHEGAAEDDGLFRFSRKHLVRGRVFFRGEELGSVCDIGFGTVEDVISALRGFIPADMPKRSVLLFRIDIVDKGMSAVYERMRGVNC
ncbi:MAG: site-specific integrase [Muribaculaceae bacterium]|nr:site-specific integrase [Muribaculaceae bacterium]